MILITGTIPIKEDARDEFAAAATTLIAATRQEDGCNAYTMTFDLIDPGTVWLQESWQTQEAMDAHLTAPHFAEFMGAVGSLIAGAPEIYKHDGPTTTRFM